MKVLNGGAASNLGPGRDDVSGHGLCLDYVPLPGGYADNP
jgi:hypothetical protein